MNIHFAIAPFLRGGRKIAQNGQTEPRLAVGYPKAYLGTSRGEVLLAKRWQKKKIRDKHGFSTKIKFLNK